MMRFKAQCLQLKNSTPVFPTRFMFSGNFISKLKYRKRSEFPVIVKWKHADLSNGGLF